MAENAKRRLAAVVVADVVGYSRMVGFDEAGTITAVKSRWDQILTPVSNANSGRVVKFLGDGALIEFSSAVDAVRACLMIQQRMEEVNAGDLAKPPVRLRIGVNLGDVILDGDDIFGDDVNIASRLEALSPPGKLCVSQSVHDAVRGKLEFVADDLGEVELKNISKPIRVFSIGPAGPSFVASKALSARPSVNSAAVDRDFTALAVLPLNNMSSNKEEDYFADGVTEDIITELSRSKHLSVVARNTTFAYKNKYVHVQEIGRLLGADFVLEGSVRLAGDRVRVTVQLIDVETGSHVFAEKFDGGVEDIFTVQDEIVEAVVSRLSFKLVDAAITQREKHPTKSSSAYTLWLRGQAVYRNGDERRARDYWHAAIEGDKNYARALSSLAHLYSYWRFSEPDAKLNAEREAQARAFASRAIRNDRTDPLVLKEAASCFSLIGDHDEALRYSDMAFALSPRDSSTLASRAFVVAFAGRHEEGLHLVLRACKFEPQLAPEFIATLGDCHFLNRNFEDALKAYRGLIDRPDYFHLNEAACLAHLGRLEEASAMARRLPRAFDTAVYAAHATRACLLRDDGDLWVEGFRIAGANV